jgi:quercetin dioxygenase-like cupin family protein
MLETLFPLMRRALMILGTVAMGFMILATTIPTDAMGAGADHAIGQKVVSSNVLPNVPGSKLTAVDVELPPGAKAPAHHHAGFVFAYVLSGTVRSQLNRGRVQDYTPGQSWVEPPGTEHTLTENPSTSTRASLLAVFVAPDGAQLTTFNK